jgi:GNAT superfamily N-acetyltransferase
MDMLVRLYDLPDASAATVELAGGGVIVRRAMAHERDDTLSWVGDRFEARGWPAEAAVAFSRQPPACWIAVCEHRPVGFACIEVTARGMLGPIGVDPDYRDRGIGRLLLLRALADQRALGYAYSVIGQVGAAEFFTRVVDARPIAGSTPGPYPSDSALRA